ncbi:hypothetical protein K438DRAFT_2100198 [Mycena galopus ATCC 62051]|nr:hypothetical protein K438DRAFT_2100198 [Mycena galopus ATCC 62051]
MCSRPMQPSSVSTGSSLEAYEAARKAGATDGEALEAVDPVVLEEPEPSREEESAARKADAGRQRGADDDEDGWTDEEEADEERTSIGQRRDIIHLVARRDGLSGFFSRYSTADPESLAQCHASNAPASTTMRCLTALNFASTPPAETPITRPGVGCRLLMQRRRYAGKGAWTSKGARDKGRRGGAAKVFFPPSAYLTSGEVAVVIEILVGLSDATGSVEVVRIAWGQWRSAPSLGDIGVVWIAYVAEDKDADDSGDASESSCFPLSPRAPAASAILGSSEVEDVVMAYVAVANPRGSDVDCFMLRSSAFPSSWSCELAINMRFAHFRRAGDPFASVGGNTELSNYLQTASRQQRDGRKKGAFGNVGIKDRAVLLVNHDVEHLGWALGRTLLVPVLAYFGFLSLHHYVVFYLLHLVGFSSTDAAKVTLRPALHISYARCRLKTPYNSSRMLASLFGYPKELGSSSAPLPASYKARPEWSAASVYFLSLVPRSRPSSSHAANRTGRWGGDLGSGEGGQGGRPGSRKTGRVGGGRASTIEAAYVLRLLLHGMRCSVKAKCSWNIEGRGSGDL